MGLLGWRKRKAAVAGQAELIAKADRAAHFFGCPASHSCARRWAPELSHLASAHDSPRSIMRPSVCAGYLGEIAEYISGRRYINCIASYSARQLYNSRALIRP